MTDLEIKTIAATDFAMYLAKKAALLGIDMKVLTVAILSAHNDYTDILEEEEKKMYNDLAKEILNTEEWENPVHRNVNKVRPYVK